MFRIVTWMMLGALLTLLFEERAIIGILIASTSLLLVELVTYFRTRQFASVEVEGRTFLLHYHTIPTLGILHHHGTINRPEYSALFLAMESRGAVVKYTADEEDEKKLPQVPATLHFNGKDYDLSVSKKWGRCPCDNPTPCYEGFNYFGIYYEDNTLLLRLEIQTFQRRKKRRRWANVHQKPVASNGWIPNPVTT